MTCQLFLHLPEKMLYLITPHQLFFTWHLLSLPAPSRPPQMRCGCLCLCCTRVPQGCQHMREPVSALPCQPRGAMRWDGTGQQHWEESQLPPYQTTAPMGLPQVAWPSCRTGGTGSPPQTQSLAFKREQHWHQVFVNDFLFLLFGQKGSTARLML